MARKVTKAKTANKAKAKASKAAKASKKTKKKPSKTTRRRNKNAYFRNTRTPIHPIVVVVKPPSTNPSLSTSMLDEYRQLKSVVGEMTIEQLRDLAKRAKQSAQAGSSVMKKKYQNLQRRYNEIVSQHRSMKVLHEKINSFEMVVQQLNPDLAKQIKKFSNSLAQKIRRNGKLKCSDVDALMMKSLDNVRKILTKLQKDNPDLQLRPVYEEDYPGLYEQNTNEFTVEDVINLLVEDEDIIQDFLKCRRQAQNRKESQKFQQEQEELNRQQNEARQQLYTTYPEKKKQLEELFARHPHTDAGTLLDLYKDFDWKYAKQQREEELQKLQQSRAQMAEKRAQIVEQLSKDTFDINKITNTDCPNSKPHRVETEELKNKLENHIATLVKDGEFPDPVEGERERYCEGEIFVMLKVGNGKWVYDPDQTPDEAPPVPPRKRQPKTGDFLDEEYHDQLANVIAELVNENKFTIPTTEGQRVQYNEPLVDEDGNDILKKYNLVVVRDDTGNLKWVYDVATSVQAPPVPKRKSKQRRLNDLIADGIERL